VVGLRATTPYPLRHLRKRVNFSARGDRWSCFSCVVLTKVMQAPDLHQVNSKTKKVVDKLIYLLLNTLIGRLRMSYCAAHLLTDS